MLMRFPLQVTFCMICSFLAPVVFTQSALAILSSKPVTQLVICIDPGHPSEVAEGTRGRHITEIQANWKIAVLAEADLKADGVQVVMTKNSEQQFVTNKHRAEIANHADANFMIRLHRDGG